MTTRILIVDDSPTDTVKLSNLLAKHGYEILTASTGEEGVEVAKKELPDVVLMDVVMPGLNGFQATRQLSRDQATKSIPVIIVTTKGQDADRVWGERQGARGFITKPVEDSLLMNTISSVLS